MVLKTDKELTLEEMGLFSIMVNIPEAKEATAEYLSNFSVKDSYKKVLRLLKVLVDEGYVIRHGNIFSTVLEKANEYIIE
ncbi:MAG: hypothetical protein IJ062_05135 [Firmicutes bacterium]|nr:hypothetical protein [Bacillota bacterium]